MAYESRFLSLEEQWFAREHPFDITVVKVKRLAKELEDYEASVEATRKLLESAVVEMNARRVSPPKEEAPAPRPVGRRIVRGSF